MSDLCIINGKLKQLSGLSDNHIISGHSIYEVLRIVDGKPAFFNAHINRLIRSAALTGMQVPNTQKIHDGIILLIENTEKKVGNIEITVNNLNSWCIKYIPHSYPSDLQYKNGVTCMFYSALRENPNAKVKRIKLRESVGDFIKTNNIYEAIYEQNGDISEGSKSNIFFIRNNQFFTPPAEMVLEGITRQIVIEIIKEAGFTINEININVKDIVNFEASFLTGTSPGILPISSIGNQKFDVNNPSLRLAMKKYEQKLAQ
ncbi:MAG: aminotransferase class IV [Salinivirgaceae bacterium]|nr:MAG: aminotransferase class IV [Salinivirgaceae bacterium]